MPCNEDLMLLKFVIQKDAPLLKDSRINFKGDLLHLEQWSPTIEFTRKKSCEKEAWIRMFTLPLHLWTKNIVKEIRDKCGGLLGKVNEDISKVGEVEGQKRSKRRTLLFKHSNREAKEGPFFLNIPTRASSYQVQIKAKTLPSVVGIFSTKQKVRVEKSQRERQGMSAFHAMKKHEGRK